jgi:hypothetical protein
MSNKVMSSLLDLEESRATKLFLFLFYLVNIFYDFFYYFILPKYTKKGEIGLPDYGLGYYIYVIEFSLLFIAVYYFKKQKQHLIKYIYFITYTVTNIINEVMIYIASGKEYQAGNIVEVFLVLFSPIFVKKSFFFLVFLGTLLKYCIVGIVIQSLEVIFPIALIIVFSIIAFLILIRFQSYIHAIKKSFEKQLESIVKGIIATLELKDPYTRGHSERVAEYSLSLAKKYKKFSQDELRSFKYACLLHDVGKVHIPDQILTKPSRLTDEEYEIIKLHPVAGAKAVKEIDGLENCIDVILFHHERWDGKGYPHGLKGEEIPIFARIISIADAFDAMTSARSYRSALPVEEAYRRIIEGQGTQFDPHLVDVFKKVYPSWVDILKKHQRTDYHERFLPEKKI